MSGDGGDRERVATQGRKHMAERIGWRLHAALEREREIDVVARSPNPCVLGQGDVDFEQRGMWEERDPAAVGAGAGVSGDSLHEVDEQAFPDVNADVVDVEEEEGKEQCGQGDVGNVEDTIIPGSEDAECGGADDRERDETKKTE